MRPFINCPPDILHKQANELFEHLENLLKAVNHVFQPNDRKKQKQMWEELRQERDKIEKSIKPLYAGYGME